MKTVVLISANSEWRAVKEILSPADIQSTGLGEWFDWTPATGKPTSNSRDTGLPETGTLFFHGGWGKVSAAATAQYAIDHFRPDLLVNLGTCGGFEGRIERGTIVLVTKTIIYDILEQMSDPDEAIANYSTELDLSWLREEPPSPVQRGLLLSADRDIVPGDIPWLAEKYGAVAADWESGAIAWVANKNGVRCLILRGVTDLVSLNRGEAYGNIELFHENTRAVMKVLLGQLPRWLNNAG
jgi:adenosylhomocysteine nucleosidase